MPASAPLEYDHFVNRWIQLYLNYPPRGQTVEDRASLLQFWWEALETKVKQGWLTAEVFEKAVARTREDVKDYLPPVGRFLETCEAYRPTQEWLPPPVPNDVLPTREECQKLIRQGQEKARREREEREARQAREVSRRVGPPDDLRATAERLKAKGWLPQQMDSAIE